MAMHARNAIYYALAAYEAAEANYDAIPAAKRAEQAARRAVDLASKALRGIKIAPRTKPSTVIWGAQRTAYYAWLDASSYLYAEHAAEVIKRQPLEFGRHHGSSIGDEGW
jgi:hypothetical protein